MIHFLKGRLLQCQYEVKIVLFYGIIVNDLCVTIIIYNVEDVLSYETCRMF